MPAALRLAALFWIQGVAGQTTQAQASGPVERTC